MKATVENTDQIVEINGIPARVWLGRTESGVCFELLVTRVAVSQNEDASQFEKELKEQPKPFISQAFPLSMII
jgi:hypothetical protein